MYGNSSKPLSGADQIIDKFEYGITWYELVIHFTLFAGKCMPIWIKVADHQPAHPFDFFSDEVKLQKPDVRSLSHQATNLRYVVQYLEHTAKIKLYPRYKKALRQPWYAWDSIVA